MTGHGYVLKPEREGRETVSALANRHGAPFHPEAGYWVLPD